MTLIILCGQLWSARFPVLLIIVQGAEFWYMQLWELDVCFAVRLQGTVILCTIEYQMSCLIDTQVEKT